MEKQTAVDYLYSLLPTMVQKDLEQKYQKAKEMERLQMQESFHNGQWDVAKHVCNDDLNKQL